MVILQTAVHKLSKQFSARWSFEKKNHDCSQIDFILFQVLKNYKKIVESCDSIREIVAISHDF